VPGGAVGRLDVLLRAALELTAEHELDHILDRMVQRAAEVAGARFARSFLGVPGDHTERTGVAVELRLVGVDDDARLPTDIVAEEPDLEVAGTGEDRRGGGFSRTGRAARCVRHGPRPAGHEWDRRDPSGP
jgi:hypothetical protein